MIAVFGCNVKTFFRIASQLGASKVDNGNLRVEIGGEEYRLFTHANQMRGCTFSAYEIWGEEAATKDLYHFIEIAKSRIRPTATIGQGESK